MIGRGAYQSGLPFEEELGDRGDIKDEEVAEEESYRSEDRGGSNWFELDATLWEVAGKLMFR